MAALREGLVLGDWLKFEERNLFSRENTTYAAAVIGGQLLQGGPSAAIAWAGSAAITGIALDSYANGDDGVAVVRHAIVSNEGLTDDNGTSIPMSETDTIAELEALGIIVREGTALAGTTIANSTPEGPSAP